MRLQMENTLISTNLMPLWQTIDLRCGCENKKKTIWNWKGKQAKLCEWVCVWWPCQLSHISLLSNYSFGTVSVSALHIHGKWERVCKHGYTYHVCACVWAHSLFVHSVALSANNLPHHQSPECWIKLFSFFSCCNMFFCSFWFWFWSGTFSSRDEQKNKSTIDEWDR